MGGMNDTFWNVWSKYFQMHKPVSEEINDTILLYQKGNLAYIFFLSTAGAHNEQKWENLPANRFYNFVF